MTMLMTQRFVLIEALFEVALESNEADVVRRAIAGLQATDAGRQYLIEHPLAV